MLNDTKMKLEVYYYVNYSKMQLGFIGYLSNTKMKLEVYCYVNYAKM
jgi:hypothetical protein